MISKEHQSQRKWIPVSQRWDNFKHKHKTNIKKEWFMQFSSVAQSSPTLCDPMDCSTPGLPVHHQLPEFTQTHVHWVSDAIQPSHPLLAPSPAFTLSQHQGLFQWVIFISGSQSTGVSASTSVLLMKIQDQFIQVTGISLSVQWLEFHTPNAGVKIWPLVRELDPTWLNQKLAD